MTSRVLVLGGTGEARRLAAALTDAGVDVVSSLAGRVAEPVLPPGQVRIGGFGGVAGLVAWLRAAPTAAVVDATHPFAAGMTAAAAEASTVTGVPLLRLQRPGWTARPGDDWRRVDSLAEAAAAVVGFGSVFVTTGRQGLAAFADVPGHCLVRSVDPPAPPLPRRATVLLARGPFTVADERALLRRHAVEVVVTKDSGGSMTAAKLTAARELGLPVVLVRRPPLPPGIPVVPTVEAVLARIRSCAI
ncbi:cobalt-precorrin-6A reductase [Blastococcus xanthinilyticus]|uniref:Precorrin-6A/cobalt-precorrin-6A reductase n=1 Tax=Blastococcus xanthinilyticus TaxID=1564164 RepID=A0A5S5CJY7_9ACTN|nr:cobalt-precorrin-6A reductase [Blastococcus xanthinilyticus]TYP80605.1 precorrin-6A/cobalt-precorrin-6A reductase [Blastococcus xanthinilyticus]